MSYAYYHSSPNDKHDTYTWTERNELVEQLGESSLQHLERALDDADIEVFCIRINTPAGDYMLELDQLEAETLNVESSS